MGRFDPKDGFYKKARKEGLRARSAYKLEEIIRKNPYLAKKGYVILDLGAAPGGFLQILATIAGNKGKVAGVDITPIKKFENPRIFTIHSDVWNENLVGKLAEYSELYDTVISDMAPATTGASSTDVARSHALVERALEISRDLLRPGGSFVAKAFMGSGFEELKRMMERKFNQVKIARPEAVRASSRECYLIGRGFKKEEG